MCEQSPAGCGEGQSVPQAPRPNLAALAAPVSPMPLPDSPARVLMETTRQALPLFQASQSLRLLCRSPTSVHTEICRPP